MGTAFSKLSPLAESKIDKLSGRKGKGKSCNCYTVGRGESTEYLLLWQQKNKVSTVTDWPHLITSWMNIRFGYLVQGSNCWNPSTFILYSITQECPLKVSALLVNSGTCYIYLQVTKLF